MQQIIDRLKIAHEQFNKENLVNQSAQDVVLIAIAVEEELAAIIRQLEILNQEHTRQTDDLRGLRDTTEEIRASVIYHRRKNNIWQDEISSLGDDVAYLFLDLENRMTAATDDAAALRGTLEGIRDTARKAENDDRPLTNTDRHLAIGDLLASVAYRAVDGLKEHQSGAALRNDMRELQKLVNEFEKGMQQTGGWSYGSDRTLTTRMQRCIDHYTRMAADAVGDSHSFKNGVVSWLRGIAINAQAVSWASTHAEKDARLRGLIEVIETAISKITELQFDDRLSSWNSVVDSWMKSDFPTREMRRRILDQEQEIKRLREKAGENEDRATGVEHPADD